jgi:hypothetical protein
MKNKIVLFSLLFLGIAIFFSCQDETLVNSANSDNNLNKIYLETIELSGETWQDLNQDGIQGADEPFFNGVKVELYSCDGLKASEQFTSGNGNYAFKDLPIGSYYLQFYPPVGWAITILDAPGSTGSTDSDIDPATGKTICITKSGNLWDAGFIQTEPQTSKLGDFVWNDLNKNGIQDLAEPGIEGVKIELFTCDGVLVNTKYSDVNGYYLFSDITPGSYYLQFNKPSGWKFTTQDAPGSNSENDSDADTATGKTACLTIDAASEILKVDAGFCKLTSDVRPRSYGYWKTHSKYGPAKYDPVWALIGEDTPFFYSGQSWYRVINTAPRRGNVYYILAHQYIAARLNEAAGVTVSPKAAEALLKATALFDNPNHTPEFVGSHRGNAELRKEFLKLSEQLGKFNQGDRPYSNNFLLN